MKTRIITTLFILVMVSALIGCSSKEKTAVGNIPIEYMQGSYFVDVNDFSNVVGDVDYVFVGYVEELLDTVYKHPVKLGSKVLTDPYTNFSITVIENIKGKLKKSSRIPIQKTGGISDDGSKIILMEDDIMLEVGKYYMLTAYGQPDGSLLISGFKSSTLINADSKSLALESNEYSFYKKAFENQKISKRPRHTSKYVE